MHFQAHRRPLSPRPLSPGLLRPLSPGSLRLRASCRPLRPRASRRRPRLRAPCRALRPQAPLRLPRRCWDPPPSDPAAPSTRRCATPPSRSRARAASARWRPTPTPRSGSTGSRCRRTSRTPPGLISAPRRLYRAIGHASDVVPCLSSPDRANFGTHRGLRCPHRTSALHLPSRSAITEHSVPC